MIELGADESKSFVEKHSSDFEKLVGRAPVSVQKFIKRALQCFPEHHYQQALSLALSISRDSNTRCNGVKLPISSVRI